LVQKGCVQKGCAQKGCAQKGCAQKGIAQKGCGGCGKAACGLCCLDVIPRAVHGVSNFFREAFTCNSVRCKADCGPIDMIDEGYEFSAPVPPNPFVEEDLPPPTLNREASLQPSTDRPWNTAPRQVRPATSRRLTPESNRPEPTPAQPTPDSAHTAQHSVRRTVTAPVARLVAAGSAHSIRPEPATFHVASGDTPERLQATVNPQDSPVVRVSVRNLTDRQDLPHNPLRD